MKEQYTITVFGAGYVGLVTAACFADAGNSVVCVDIDKKKIESLNQGVCPIYEPGLEELLIKHTKTGRLHFTTDVEKAVAHGVYQFIAVGTPSDEDGSADLQYVLAVASTIGQYMQHDCIVIDKSTVPVGTADKVNKTIQDKLDKRKVTHTFSVVSNPEFLKEGAALKDFMQPDRIVVGTNGRATLDKMRQLYQPFIEKPELFIGMDVRSAELTKYAANAMLALKISFMNELSNVAEAVGADIKNIQQGIGSDKRIGPLFLNPGPGFGGSCFPKDIRALRKTARDYGVEEKLLASIEDVNKRQKQVIFNKIKYYFKDNLAKKTIAVWGLAFKANTDDMRESPSQALLELLWQADVKVQAFDPQAMIEAKRIFANQSNLVLCDSMVQALENADALVVMTEWQDFREPDFAYIKEKLKRPVIFDGRNLYDWCQLEKLGFDYFCIGRKK